MAEPENEIPKINPNDVERLIEKFERDKLEERDKQMITSLLRTLLTPALKNQAAQPDRFGMVAREGDAPTCKRQHFARPAKSAGAAEMFFEIRGQKRESTVSQSTAGGLRSVESELNAQSIE